MSPYALVVFISIVSGSTTFLISEAATSHSDTPHSVGILWTSDRPVAETLPENTQYSRQTSMPPAGFEPAIPARERPQTHALDHAATGIGTLSHKTMLFRSVFCAATGSSQGS